MTTKELREKKGSLIHQMEDIKNQAALENRLLNDEESKRFDLLDDDMEKINAEIRRYEKLEAEAAIIDPDKSENQDEKYSRAFERLVRSGERTDALSPGAKDFRGTQSGQNTTSTTGGYLVPTLLGDKVIKRLFTLSPIRNWATVFTTAGRLSRCCVSGQGL